VKESREEQLFVRKCPEKKNSSWEGKRGKTCIKKDAEKITVKGGSSKQKKVRRSPAKGTASGECPTWGKLELEGEILDRKIRVR